MISLFIIHHLNFFIFLSEDSALTTETQHENSLEDLPHRFDTLANSFEYHGEKFSCESVAYEPKKHYDREYHVDLLMKVLQTLFQKVLLRERLP